MVARSRTNTDGTRALCDTATRWATDATGTDVQPQWIDYTGNDSFESITTAGTAIYVGGHERWVNNGSGSDSAGPGASRVRASPRSTRSTACRTRWNPGRNPRGAGAYAVFVNSQGLYVGSDTAVDRHRLGVLHPRPDRVLPAGRRRERPDLHPGGAARPRVYTAGQLPNGTNTNVLYRVDAGGPVIPAIDNGPDWAADQNSTSPYRDATSNAAGWSQVPNVNPSVPATTPSAIFNSERYGKPELELPGHARYADRGPPLLRQPLHRYQPASASASSTSRLDGTVVLNHYDIVADAGDQTGTMHAYDLNAPASGKVTIGLSNIVENPLINGIEIVRTDIAPPSSSALDTLQ